MPEAVDPSTVPQDPPGPEGDGSSVVPFESRIVIHADGTVVVEHAGEGLEDLPGILGGAGGGDRPDRACPGSSGM